MATWKPQDAVDFAKRYIKGMTFDRVDAGAVPVSVQACDSAAQMLWMAAPWRWTVGSLPAFPLEGGKSDYPFTKPTDFLYLQSAYIWDTQKKDLVVVPALPDSVLVQGAVEEISYVNTGAEDVIRVSARPSPSSTDQFLVAMYKKHYTPITASNVTTAGAVGIPDEWFWVFRELVLYFAYRFADDTRAGGAQATDEGKAGYTGQLGVAMAGITEMRKAEGIA